MRTKGEEWFVVDEMLKNAHMVMIIAIIGEKASAFWEAESASPGRAN